MVAFRHSFPECHQKSSHKTNFPEMKNKLKCTQNSLAISTLSPFAFKLIIYFINIFNQIFKNKQENVSLSHFIYAPKVEFCFVNASVIFFPLLDKFQLWYFCLFALSFALLLKKKRNHVSREWKRSFLCLLSTFLRLTFMNVNNLIIYEENGEKLKKINFHRGREWNH